MANTKNTPKAVVITYGNSNTTTECKSIYQAVKILKGSMDLVAGQPHLTKYLDGQIKSIRKLSDLNITVAYKK